MVSQRFFFISSLIESIVNYLNFFFFLQRVKNEELLSLLSLSSVTIPFFLKISPRNGTKKDERETICFSKRRRFG